MKILVSLSAKDDKKKEEIARMRHNVKATQKDVTLGKKRLKAAQKRLETALKYSKSKDPEVAAKNKNKAYDEKRAVKTYERRLNSKIKDVARFEKKLAKLKDKFEASKKKKSAKLKG